MNSNMVLSKYNKMIFTKMSPLRDKIMIPNMQNHIAFQGCSLHHTHLKSLIMTTLLTILYLRNKIWPTILTMCKLDYQVINFDLLASHRQVFSQAFYPMPSTSHFAFFNFFSKILAA